MEECQCHISGSNGTWVTRTRSDAEKEYIFNKYLRPSPTIERKGKKYKGYCVCRIGMSYWGYVKPSFEEQEELQQIVFGKEDEIEVLARNTLKLLNKPIENFFIKNSYDL